ncbi:Tannase/feruloyl esterase [Rhexocercosporidium sp. MPI-PUGE-AT-0058]|nr:Tannase/feruloyl esterase [Rhexocercosporidium sp. MPI-PUGE-AT-0058]
MCTILRISLAAVASCALAAARSSVFPDCSGIAHASFSAAFPATFLNVTYYDTGTLNVSGIVNKVSFCEFLVSIRYGKNVSMGAGKSDSLQFALWLPELKYPSRLMALGNGGEAGVINYDDMMDDLNSGLGFAVAAGNAGHLFSDNDAGVGTGLGAPGVYQPYFHDEDQVKAWLHDAISIFTPAAKSLMESYYGYRPQHSYFRSCSTGGAQAFSLAEFHPDLFDGIIAGCPANWFTHLSLAFLWGQQQTKTDATTLPAPVLDFIQASVIKECDLIDGVADNLIENPLACPFNISSLACTAAHHAENITCITPSQLSAAKALYQGPVRSDSPSTSIFPGYALGSEGGWSLPQVQGAMSNAITIPILQNLVYQNLSYDPSTFNWASDVDFLDARVGPLIDAITTNFTSFRKSGKKMIVYAGWADPMISPMWSMQHVEAITKATMGSQTTIAENDFIKLVMVPGGGHCGAQVAKYPYVPAQYGFSSAIVDWVENKTEPVEGIKSWGPTNGENRTRRLCTWPLVAKFKAGGDVDDWESYTCG